MSHPPHVMVSAPVQCRRDMTGWGDEMTIYRIEVGSHLCVCQQLPDEIDEKHTLVPALKQLDTWFGRCMLFTRGRAQHDPHHTTSIFVPPLCTISTTVSFRAKWETLWAEKKHELASLAAD